MEAVGFSFDNCRRYIYLNSPKSNQKLLSDERMGKNLPQPKKTGTTIAGAKTPLFLAHVEQEHLVRIVTAVTIVKRYLFRYQGHVGAYLIIGGVDTAGSHLYSVSNRGHTDRLPFITNGSGCLASISYFESNFRADFELEEAKEFVANGISAGVFNDLGSGSNVDLCIITKHGMEMLRNYRKLCSRNPLLRDYTFPKGTTRTISQKISNITYDIISTETLSTQI
ncbi:hypothetical protein MXB_3613 [Myxobolus squamalis]|nr:hypothetical protein MXB_3613 [Myxobolus squamalis]